MISNQSIRVQKISKNDQSWIKGFYKERWGSERIVSRGILRYVPLLPGFIAWRSGERVGLLTYHIENNELEIVTLDSLAENIGVGSALVAEAAEFARELNCFRVWLITTNDNTPALRFYQKRGFQLAVIHRNALDESRKLKPEIPQLGLNGIPLRDEIELEIPLNP